MINIEELAYDEDKTLDISFGEEYERTHLKETYRSMETTAIDERLTKLADIILDEGIARKATDIQYTAWDNQWGIIKYRIGKKMIPARRIHAKAMGGLIAVYKKRGDMDVNVRVKTGRGRMTYNYRGNEYNLRLSIIPTIKGCGENLGIRILYDSELGSDVTNLGLAEPVLQSLQQVLKMNQGLVLLTGATGSGKTTTLYTSIQHILNQTDYEKNIMTIEEPVEYQMRGVVQTQVDTTEGIDVSFSEGLKTILRQNPDVILLGEINDHETAKTAVRASTSGHLVFSTLHTNDVLSIGEVLDGYGVNRNDYVWAIELVLNQRLEARLCPDCKEDDVMISTHDNKWLKTLEVNESLTGVSERGNNPNCPRCKGTGYHGVVLLCSMLDATSEYKRIATETTKTVDLEMQLRQNERVRYYRIQQDVYRHLMLGNIDMETAKRVLR